MLKFYRSCREGDPVLLRPKHIQFLKKAITNLNDTYEVSTTFNIKQHMCNIGCFATIVKFFNAAIILEIIEEKYRSACNKKLSICTEYFTEYLY